MAPTMAAVTAVVVVVGGLVAPRGGGTGQGGISVDGDVVLEELTSAVATTVGVRFTLKLSISRSLE